MHGGVKVYRGAASAARAYVEADRSRADDYYLAEGSGLARRFTASPGDGVTDLGVLDGDGYETWVAGHDPDTGQARGRLRDDGNAVRFVEVTVNGPKTWSLAAALHPEIAAAYDAAQDRAAEQIIGWLAEHATTRVGPRGRQVQVPVEGLEAATVRHYTSRAGDPHRHLHLQINARVFAAGKWRGLHTVGVRDSLEAINGIGHAAVMCDPEFRAAFAAHGYTMDPAYRGGGGAGAVTSGRSARGTRRSGGTWTATRPNGGPPTPARSPARRCAGRGTRGPGRTPAPTRWSRSAGPNWSRHWNQQLSGLGYRDPVTAARAADRGRRTAGGWSWTATRRRDILARWARRSAWNAADIRGEVERRSPPPGSWPTARCASSWPRTSPPARWRLRAAAGSPACPSTSGPGRRRRCSRSRPT